MRRFVISLIVCLSLVATTVAIDEILSPIDVAEQWLSATIIGDDATLNEYTCQQNQSNFVPSPLPDDVIAFISAHASQDIDMRVDLSDVNIVVSEEKAGAVIVKVSGEAQVSINETPTTLSMDGTILNLVVEDERWTVCLTEANIANVIPESRTDDGAFLLGDPNAPVTIVIFEDYLCPHCQSYHPIMEEFLETEVRAGNANVEFRHLISIDRELSPLVFQMVECGAIMSEAPDAYRQARNEMFELTTTTRLSNQTIRQYVANLDLPYDDFVACVENDATQWVTDIELAQTLDWVRGTPAIGWRTGDGDIQQTNPSRPSVEELADLVRENS